MSKRRYAHPLLLLNQTADDLDLFRQQLYRMFDRPADDVARVRSFPIELTESSEAYQLRAMLPGIAPEQIDIQATGDTLTLSVDHQPMELPKETVVHYREFTYGTFERSIQFSQPILNEQIEARYQHGVLTLVIPKEESSRKKSIKVQVQS